MIYTIDLPFPDKCLWPNGRAHWATKARAFRKHKDWAAIALLADRPVKHVDGRVDWDITIHPKTRNVIDADNAIAAMKAYADGIALALHVDDGTFNAPTLTFGEPIKGGRVRINVNT